MVAEPLTPTSFGATLSRFRKRAGRSFNDLAREVGVDPSYLTRLERGEREPPRHHVVEDICRALKISVPERNELLVSAGYAPLSIVQLGGWDDALQAVVDVLTDPCLTDEDRAEYRQVLQVICRRWRASAAQHGNGRDH